MYFLELADPVSYYSGKINQVTVKPITKSKKIIRNGREEEIILPFVRKGDCIRTNLGDAAVCSVIWYRGKLKLCTLLDDGLESWAQAEGFSGFYDADEHFTKKYGEDWLEQELMSVKFKIEGVTYD